VNFIQHHLSKYDSQRIDKTSTPILENFNSILNGNDKKKEEKKEDLLKDGDRFCPLSCINQKVKSADFVKLCLKIIEVIMAKDSTVFTELLQNDKKLGVLLYHVFKVFGHDDKDSLLESLMFLCDNVKPNESEEPKDAPSINNSSIIMQAIILFTSVPLTQALSSYSQENLIKSKSVSKLI